LFGCCFFRKKLFFDCGFGVFLNEPVPRFSSGELRFPQASYEQSGKASIARAVSMHWDMFEVSPYFSLFGFAVVVY